MPRRMKALMIEGDDTLHNVVLPTSSPSSHAHNLSLATFAFRYEEAVCHPSSNRPSATGISVINTPLPSVPFTLYSKTAPLWEGYVTDASRRCWDFHTGKTCLRSVYYMDHGVFVVSESQPSPCEVVELYDAGKAADLIGSTSCPKPANAIGVFQPHLFTGLNSGQQ
ncbi:hypothetical protein FRC03_001841 [Tulasnella sp. 419]|nr:hypothetical protein FRC03_001841 [Tulasnella sp. 419]